MKSIIPILSAATTLEKFKRLVPIAYEHCTTSETEFIETTIKQAQTLDKNFTFEDLQLIIGNKNDIDQSDSTDWVEKMNKDFAWIEENCSIYRLEYRNFIESRQFKLQFDNQVINIGSAEKPKFVDLGTAWIKDPGRRQHRQLVFRPNEGLITKDNCLNEWSGFSMKPVQGSVDPFLSLLSRLVPEPKAKDYVLTWLVHLIQYPDVKMHTSLVFWSHEQGIGKNLMTEVVAEMIGNTHATVIGQTELTGNFNSRANRRIFVIGDEVSNSDRRKDNDKLKGLITSTRVRHNEKYQPSYETPNLMNFIFLSNHCDALFLSNHDRRYFIWEVTSGRLPEAVVKSFVQWKNNKGLAALLYHFQNYDIKDFNPKSHAPMTAAKQQMTQDNHSDLEAWISELMASNVSQIICGEIVVARQLAEYYDNETNRRNTSAKAVTRVCKSQGAYARPSQVRLNNSGRKVRAMAIANMDYWKRQPETVWSEELEKMKPNIVCLR